MASAAEVVGSIEMPSLFAKIKQEQREMNHRNKESTDWADKGYGKGAARCQRRKEHVRKRRVKMKGMQKVICCATAFYWDAVRCVFVAHYL